MGGRITVPPAFFSSEVLSEYRNGLHIEMVVLMKLLNTKNRNMQRTVDSSGQPLVEHQSVAARVHPLVVVVVLD